MFWVLKFAKKAATKGETVTDTLKAAIREFTIMNGRMPSSGEMNKMEAIINGAQSNVINRTNLFKSKQWRNKVMREEIPSKTNPIDQRWVDQEEWAAKKRAENKAAVKGLEEKFGKPEDRVSGSLITLEKLEKLYPRIRTESLLEASKTKDPKKLNEMLKTFRRIENEIDASPPAKHFSWPEEDMASGGLAGQLHLNQGGRVRFDNGGMSRRKFLQLMGGLASVPILGKFFKFAKPAATAMKAVETSNAAGMPKWFPSLVNKVLKEGEDIGGTVERQIVKQVELPKSKTKVTVEHDLNTGDTIVDVGRDKHGWSDGWHGQPVRLHLKKGEWVEPDMDLVTGKLKKQKPVKKRDEFDVEEAEFTGDAESVKYEESTFNKFGEHGSDFSEVEKYATGKVTKGSKPTKQVWEADWDDVIDTDYAKGGLAGVLKL